MAKLKDFTFAETSIFHRLEDHDKRLLEREVNFNCYHDLQQMARDQCNLLVDDEIFSECEWNLFHAWYEQYGFTEDDWEYVKACGYEEDQF